MFTNFVQGVILGLQNRNVTRCDMTTLKAVAKLAGVSTTTASYALNNRPEVKEETKLKVQAAAKQLGYVPNNLAKRFRYSKTHTIMVITSESIESGNTFSNEFYGILAGAREKNYDVLVKLVSSKIVDKFEIENIVGNNLSDGIILLGNHLDGFAQYIVSKEISGVLLSSHTDVPILTINVDGERCSREITEFSFSKGAMSPFYLTYNSDDTEEILRMKGFAEALTKRGVDEIEDRVIFADDYGRDFHEIVKKIVRLGGDAVICWNDEVAMHVLTEAQKNGVSVPEKLMVAGFDGSFQFSGLTTIKQNFIEKGRRAVNQLVEQIETGKRLSGTLHIEASIERGDTM